MSFISDLGSKLKDIGKFALNIAAAPGTASLLSIVAPGAGIILGNIVRIETYFASMGKAEGTGVEKAATGIQLTDEAFNVYRAMSAMRGKDVQYDVEKLKKAQTDGVTFMNSSKDFWDSVKEVDIKK